MEIELQESVSQSELEAIQKIAPHLGEQDVFTFPLKIIDDQPTANGRIWSKEWQKANAENFIGVAVTVNHENKQELVIGRIYEAEQKDNAVYGKVYVPLTTDVGSKAKANIEGGLFKSVSLNARATNTQKDGDYTRILPGENDRVYEVSFVAVGGCETCVVQTESACESGQQEQTEQETWNTYAEELKEAAINEVVKAAAFVFGEGVKEKIYRSLADKLAPCEIQTLASDLKETYDRLQTVKPEGDNRASSVKQAVDRIKAVKG